MFKYDYFSNVKLMYICKFQMNRIIDCQLIRQNVWFCLARIIITGTSSDLKQLCSHTFWPVRQKIGSLGSCSTRFFVITILFQYAELFDKIDVTREGTVDWDKFASHMLLEFYEKDDRVKSTQVPQWKDLKQLPR